MARPKKWRRVAFIPEIQYFAPAKPEAGDGSLPEVVLHIEELEAVRLRDLEGLEQQDCGERMEVSRQTFQRILNSARTKIADSLINGKALRIEGGNYTRNICRVTCLACGHHWLERYEDFAGPLEKEIYCDRCGSRELTCTPLQRRQFCHRHCGRHGRRGRGRGRG